MALNGISLSEAKAALERAVGKNPTGTRTLRLYTAAPNLDATGGTECSYTGYTAPTTADTDWNNATNISNQAIITNAVALDLPTVTSGADVHVVYAAIWASGVMKAMGPLSLTLVAGDPAAIVPVGQLKVTIDPNT